MAFGEMKMSGNVELPTSRVVVVVVDGGWE